MVMGNSRLGMRTHLAALSHNFIQKSDPSTYELLQTRIASFFVHSPTRISHGHPLELKYIILEWDLVVEQHTNQSLADGHIFNYWNKIAFLKVLAT